METKASPGSRVSTKFHGETARPPATGSAKRRGGAILAWLLCALSVVLAVTGAGLNILNGVETGNLVFLLIVGAGAFVGGLVAARFPTNPVGWLFLAGALSVGLGVATHEYAVYGLITRPGSLPFARFMTWPQSWLWVPGAVLILALVPLYFPDGRLVSNRWRIAVWVTQVFFVLAVIHSAIQPGEMQESGFNNPFGIDKQPRIFHLIGAVILPMWFGVLFASASSVIIRFRRSVGVQRQQIKWLAFSALLVPCWFLVSTPVETVSPSLFILIDSLVIVAIPIAAGFAMLRYRLYEIDLLINRTLVYLTLTVCIIGLYVLLVAYIGAIFNAEDNLLVPAVATGVVAAMFAPLRDRLQREVNRLMYGERNDPHAVLSRLSERLRGTTAPEAALHAIVDTVATSLKVPYVAIVARNGQQMSELAVYGDIPDGALTSLALSYAMEEIGELRLAPRAPGEPFDDLDRHLLDHLARHAEAATYASLLTWDLQRSRERLVAAREEERLRLRRDLHDGLGPQLATLTLKVESARHQVRETSPDLDAILMEIKVQTQAAIADIRRLVYGLRPPSLDQFGLVSAIHELAAACSPHGVEVTVKTCGIPCTLPPAVEVAAYRIVQEAMTNVIRHAAARNCKIWLALVQGSRIELWVTDDGRGIDTHDVLGVGLTSMKERAGELGGACTVNRMADTGGSEVHAWLPLHTTEEEP